MHAFAEKVKALQTLFPRLRRHCELGGLTLQEALQRLSGEWAGAALCPESCHQMCVFGDVFCLLVPFVWAGLQGDPTAASGVGLAPENEEKDDLSSEERMDDVADVHGAPVSFNVLDEEEEEVGRAVYFMDTLIQFLFYHLAESWSVGPGYRRATELPSKLTVRRGNNREVQPPPAGLGSAVPALRAPSHVVRSTSACDCTRVFRSTSACVAVMPYPYRDRICCVHTIWC